MSWPQALVVIIFILALVALGVLCGTAYRDAIAAGFGAVAHYLLVRLPSFKPPGGTEKGKNR